MLWGTGGIARCAVNSQHMIRRSGSERCNAWHLINQQTGLLLSQHRVRSEIHMLVHYFRNRYRDECDCKDIITMSLEDSP